MTRPILFRTVSLILVALFSTQLSQSQVKGGDFQKLFDLYALEKYEQCAFKAENFTRKDKYRRAPEPYLYLALCLYQFHTNPDEYETEIRDPIKDALKYAYKFRKYDKTGELYAANQRQIDQIREEALDRAKFYFNDGDYRKSALEFKRILKVLPDDVNILFMTGVTQILSRNVTEGEKNINQALDTLRVQKAEDRFEKDDVTYEALVKAFVGYTNYLVENNEIYKAQVVIQLGRELAPSDLTLKSQYKKIYAKEEEE